MLKSCKYCGRIHDSKVVCKQKGIAQKQRGMKKDTIENRFRWTQEWKDKREDIKRRDKYLCQICIRNLYDTKYIYNYKSLSVHHAIPLVEDYQKRVDDNNLLTVCDRHHEMCESEEIPRSMVLKIIFEQQISPRG